MLSSLRGKVVLREIVDISHELYSRRGEEADGLPLEKGPPRHFGGYSVSRVTAAVLLTLAFAVVPAPTQADSYEILHSGLFQTGTSWQFKSYSAGGLFTQTWEFVGTATVGPYNTNVLRETTPWAMTEYYMLLDPVGMTIVREYDTEYNPPGRYQTDYSNPLEKVPRVVNVTDKQKQFGTGYGTVVYLENPSQYSTRDHVQYVTYLKLERITVPAGTFDCRVIQVDETWRYTGGAWAGYWGKAARTYWMERRIGFIGRTQTIYEYTPQNALYRQTVSSHELSNFVSALPDLRVDAGAFSPSSSQQGQPLSVEWREWADFQSALAHASTVYLSTDTVITNHDTALTTVSVPAIVAGSAQTIPTNAIIPRSLPNGQYYVGIMVDTRNQVAELDETSYTNTLLLGGRLTIIGPPDLTVSNLSFSPDVLSPGEILYVNATISNIGGTGTPTTWARVYLSTNRVINTAVNFPLITGIEVTPLPPQTSAYLNRSAMVPLGFPNGGYYVGVVCDFGNGVVESDEDNNVAVSAQPAMIGLPDLQVTGGGFAPMTIWPGRRITVQATIRNTGPRDALATMAEIRLSTDTVISSRDVLMQSGLNCPALTSGSYVTINATPVVPAATTLGNYYVGVVCDATNVVSEANEGNNGAALPGRLSVVAPPDLQIAELDFEPIAVTTGGSFRLLGYVFNAGGVATAATVWVEFFVSPRDDFQPPRYFLCQSKRIGPLGPGQYYSFSDKTRTVPAGIPAGQYTVGIVVDRLNEGFESDKSNNTAWVRGKKLYVNTPVLGASRWQLYR